jgi:hypothetical protein
MGRFLRRVLAPVAGVGLAVLVPAVAAAEPAETFTETGSDTTTFMDVGPGCGAPGEVLEITIEYHYVFHQTATPTGYHETFTNTGTFEAVGVNGTGTGHFTEWGGFNATPGGAVNGTYTFSVRGVAPDGSRIAFHVTDHFNVTPTGAENFFTLCKD